MPDFKTTLEMLPWVLGTLVVTSCVHEAGHAWTAWRLGDRSEHVAERKTPFTLKHISLVFTIILPSVMMMLLGMMLGGARPVQVRTAIGPARMALVALAGPVGNIVCGVLSILVVAGLVHGGVLIPSMGMGFDKHYIYALHAVLLNFMLAALNLLPVPPFDGSRIVALFLPARLRPLYYSFTIPAIICVLVLFVAIYFVFDEEFGRIVYEVLLKLHNCVLGVRDWVR